MNLQEKICAITRWSLAIIFFYHGLIPKLIYGNHQEILMNSTMMSSVPETVALMVSGVLEVLISIFLILLYRNKVLLYVVLVFIGGVSIQILVMLPGLYQNAFNPFSLNLSVIVFSILNLMTHPEKLHT